MSSLTLKEFKAQDALGLITVIDKTETASDSNTSKEILEYLSKDKDWIVRFKVARNPNTPIETLKELSKDKDENNIYVRYYANENLLNRTSK